MSVILGVKQSVSLVQQKNDSQIDADSAYDVMWKWSTRVSNGLSRIPCLPNDLGSVKRMGTFISSPENPVKMVFYTLANFLSAVFFDLVCNRIRAGFIDY